MDSVQFNKIIKNNSNSTLASLFDVDPQIFSDVKLSDIDFSVRARNCINIQGYTSLDEILSSTIKSIMGWRNLGVGTLKEIIDKCKSICNDRSSIEGEIASFAKITINDIKQLINTTTDPELLFKYFSDLLKVVPDDHHDKKILTDKLHKYDVLLHKENVLFEQINFNSIMSHKKCYPFILAYNYINNNILDNYQEYLELDLNELKRKIPLIKDVDKIIKWHDFFLWCSNNQIFELHNIVFNDCDTRTKDLINELAAGNTLESVGNNFQITRERVRQIQNTFLRKLKSSMSKLLNDVFMPIYAINEGKTYLGFNDIEDILAGSSKLLWYLIENKIFDKQKLGYYSEKHKLYIYELDNTSDMSTISNMVLRFPELLKSKDMDEYILNVQEKMNCSSDLVLVEVNRQFIKYKDLYSRHKLNLVEMCDYVTKKYFYEGVDFNNHDQISDLLGYLKTLFNYDTSNLSIRYLRNCIMECCFQYDFSCYKNNEHLQFNDNDLKVIEEFISNKVDKSKRSAISFNEIYMCCKDKLSDSISNKYILHSVVNTMDLPYYSSRDYLLKDVESCFDDDFVDYIRKIYPITIEELSKKYFITEEQVRQVISRCKRLYVKSKFVFYK